MLYQIEKRILTKRKFKRKIFYYPLCFFCCFFCVSIYTPRVLFICWFILFLYFVSDFVTNNLYINSWHGVPKRKCKWGDSINMRTRTQKQIEESKPYGTKGVAIFSTWKINQAAYNWCHLTTHCLNYLTPPFFSLHCIRLSPPLHLFLPCLLWCFLLPTSTLEITERLKPTFLRFIYHYLVLASMFVFSIFHYNSNQ
jgi:hypothetical protein